MAHENGGGGALSPSLWLLRSGVAATAPRRDLDGAVTFHNGEWLLAQIRGCPGQIQGLRVWGAHLCGGSGRWWAVAAVAMTSAGWRAAVATTASNMKGRKGGGCGWHLVLAAAATGVTGPTPLGHDGPEMVGPGASCAQQLGLRWCSRYPPRRRGPVPP
jgi:hypothetical protein